MLLLDGTGGHFSGQQHLGGPDVAAAGPVSPGQRGAEPGGLREERPALLPLAPTHREGRGVAGLVRQRPHRPAAAQFQQSASQKQRWASQDSKVFQLVFKPWHLLFSFFSFYFDFIRCRLHTMH